MSELSRPCKGVDLSKARCNPSAEYRKNGFAMKEGWVMRLSLESELGAILPLFIHVYYNQHGRLEAELESDQTDYAKPNWPHSIKRAYLKNLKFWG